jgi:hypothetical protein
VVEMLRRDLYDVDRATNLLPMPGKNTARQANPNLLGHQGPHPNYSRMIERELERAAQTLSSRYGNLGRVPDAELEKAIKAIENRARRRILNNDPAIQFRNDPNTGTRVLSDANLDNDPEAIS